MEFNRRRFLAIGSMALTNTFLPKSVFGEEAAVVAAEKDRFALTASAWKNFLDIIPDYRVFQERVPYNGTKEWYEQQEVVRFRDAFSRTGDEAIGVMLKHFTELPPVDAVQNLLDRAIYRLDETDLRTAGNLTPVACSKFMINARVPINPTTGMENFVLFAARYRHVLSPPSPPVQYPDKETEDVFTRLHQGIGKALRDGHGRKVHKIVGGEIRDHEFAFAIRNIKDGEDTADARRFERYVRSLDPSYEAYGVKVADLIKAIDAMKPKMGPPSFIRSLDATVDVMTSYFKPEEPALRLGEKLLPAKDVIQAMADLKNRQYTPLAAHVRGFLQEVVNEARVNQTPDPEFVRHVYVNDVLKAIDATHLDISILNQDQTNA